MLGLPFDMGEVSRSCRTRVQHVPVPAEESQMNRIAVDAVWLPTLGHGEPSVMRMTGLPSRTNTVVFTSLRSEVGQTGETG